MDSKTGNRKKRVLIVDDHGVMREGLKRILNDCADLKVAGEAASGEEALSMMGENRYDLVLLDISLPGRGGMDALKEMRRLAPETPVLMLSMHPEDQYAMRAFREGAAGYVMKEQSPDEMLVAIRKVVAGGTHITPSLAEKLAASLAGNHQGAKHEELSNREDQVLRLLAAGKPIKTIGERLSLDVRTVGTYKRRVLKKLGLRTLADLVRYAIDNKLTPST